MMLEMDSALLILLEIDLVMISCDWLAVLTMMNFR